MSTLKLFSAVVVLTLTTVFILGCDAKPTRTVSERLLNVTPWGHFLMLGPDGNQLDIPWGQYGTIIYNSFALSPDGKRWAFPVRQDNRFLMVAGGIQGKQYDFLGHVIFSPDSKHLAYSAGMGPDRLGDRFVVVDGIEGKQYQFVRGDIVFSPDSQRLAYYAQTLDNRYVIVVDGEERDVGQHQF